MDCNSDRDGGNRCTNSVKCGANYTACAKFVNFHMKLGRETVVRTCALKALPDTCLYDLDQFNSSIRICMFWCADKDDCNAARSLFLSSPRSSLMQFFTLFLSSILYATRLFWISSSPVTVTIQYYLSNLLFFLDYQCASSFKKFFFKHDFIIYVNIICCEFFFFFLLISLF